MLEEIVRNQRLLGTFEPRCFFFATTKMHIFFGFLTTGTSSDFLIQLEMYIHIRVCICVHVHAHVAVCVCVCDCS